MLGITMSRRLTMTQPAEETNHDSLFKWLVTLFHREFFAHYFPSRKVGKVEFIDKEFLAKYDALKDSLENDLLLVIELELDGNWHSLVVNFEHKSWRTNPEKQVMEYMVLAWLLKRRPVWSIVFFTDEAMWRKEMPNKYWLGYSDIEGKQFYSYDIIKVNREKSEQLIAEGSLFSCLLALKADATGIDRAEIVRAIYQRGKEMGSTFTNEHKLLASFFIDAYSKVPEKTKIMLQEETQMPMVATTISEHFINIGEARGEARGVKGEAQAQIQNLQELFDQGQVSQETYDQMMPQLQQRLAKIMAGTHPAT